MGPASDTNPWFTCRTTFRARVAGTQRTPTCRAATLVPVSPSCLAPSALPPDECHVGIPLLGLMYCAHDGGEDGGTPRPGSPAVRLALVGNRGLAMNPDSAPRRGSVVHVDFRSGSQAPPTSPVWWYDARGRADGWCWRSPARWTFRPARSSPDIGGDPCFVVFDLQGVTFMDCSSLRVIQNAQHRALAAGGEVRLAAASEQVMRILTVTRLDGVFPTFDSVRDATSRGVNPSSDPTRRRSGRPGSRRPGVRARCCASPAWVMVFGHAYGHDGGGSRPSPPPYVLARTQSEYINSPPRGASVVHARPSIGLPVPCGARRGGTRRTRSGRWLVLEIAGEMDIQAGPLLSDIGGDPSFVVFDLHGVAFKMDCSSLRVLQNAQHRVLAAGGSVRLAAASKQVLRVLALTHLERAFSLYDAVQDATSVPPVPAARVEALPGMTEASGGYRAAPPDGSTGGEKVPMASVERTITVEPADRPRSGPTCRTSRPRRNGTRPR